ncbi:hypothetical protein TWF718_004587 [Orbilia javanica]|uniref:Uncharacterized protein n=1 Tax=Orbilia javanica TaxID=47235 RepID=A0AAN8N2Y6_9PEZI
MAFSKLLSPSKTALLVVSILSAVQTSVSAPTADIGTTVSSAPKPVPNSVPGSIESLQNKLRIVPSPLNSKDEIKRRDLDVVYGNGIPSDSITQSTVNPPKRLGKRQFQQMSVSAPAILSRPPGSPNTNDEEDAIGAAAEKIKQAADEAVNHMEKVANAAVRNAAEEQKEGIDNPNFHGSQDNSYVWPSAAPALPAWPTNVASTWDPLASAAASAGQGFRVLDGNGELIRDDALQPNAVISPQGQPVDAAVSNELGAPFQVLSGDGQPLQDGALQPKRVVAPVGEPIQVFDGSGNPIEDVNGALQPERIIAPVSEPVQVFDGNGNPIEDVNGALQPERIVAPVGEPIRVFDGSGNPIEDVNGALQPERIVAPVSEPVQVFDGSGNPIEDVNGALQPERIVAPVGEPLQVLDGNGNKIQDLNQYTDPTILNQPEPVRILNGDGSPLTGGALQPPPTTPEYFTPNILDNNQILNDAGQTIQDPDLSVVPAIASNPDLWRQVLDDPNVQKFLRDNTPEGLQPLLDPSTKDQLEQDPSIANSIVPSLNNPTPEGVTPFLNLLDALPINDKLTLVNEGPDIARLAQPDPSGFSDVINAIENLQTPSPFPADGFRSGFLPAPSVHTDTGSMLFTPNGFEMSPVGPFGGPRLLPQLDGINQNFDGTINQPFVPNQDIFGGTFGAMPTNVFLPNGGTISFNCVPIYIDANGEQHAASDVPSQILSAFNVGDMPMPTTEQSSFKDQTTDPNTPLTSFLSEVVAQNPDILSASQIDENTVLVNTEGGDDAEKVFGKLQNGWGLEAEKTGDNGLDLVTLENGGTKFQISQPQGFATARILEAKTPADVLGQVSEGASIQLETVNVAPAPASA